MDWTRLGLHARGLGLRVWGILGDAPVAYEGGVGGWEAVGRPLHEPLTVWRSSPELRCRFTLLFDGFAAGDSVEADLRKLERMAGLDRDRSEPPVVELLGVAAAEGRGSGEWVIESLTWGDDALRRPRDGHRIRQTVEVVLLEYVEDAGIRAIKASRKPVYRYVRAANGDTWRKLAKRHLKAQRLGLRLARLNGARSATAKVKAGTRVRLPTDAALRKWRAALK